MKILLFCFLFLSMLLHGQSCPYHDRLRALAAAQRERNAKLRRLNLRRQSTGSLSDAPLRGSQPSNALTSGGASSTVHINTRPDQTRYTGYSSNRGYFVQPNTSPQRHVYIGNVETVYQPENYVKCPNSRYHVCPLGSVCLYEFGSYTCRRNRPSLGCREGLKRVNISSIQYQCVDINECNDPEVNNCEQVCKNTQGSFYCTCDPGFTTQSYGTCADTDECTRLNRCQHECVNTVGSYECSCPVGYNLLTNISRCRDIDECAEEAPCNEGEECLNTYGGYQCNLPPSCGPGYHRSNSSGGGTGPCVIDVYDPSSNLPVSISSSTFALHSNYPAYTDVGKLHFARQAQHRYFFRIIGGSTHFSVIQRSYLNYIVIRTKRRLHGPSTYEVRVLVTDYDDTNYGSYGTYRPRRTTSRVDLNFIVSQYEF